MMLNNIVVALLHARRAGSSPTPSPPPPPPPPEGDLVVAVRIEYVDASGIRQSFDPLETGAPTITGVAPLLMTIDATGTRANAAFAAYAGSAPAFLASSYPASTDQTAKAREAYSFLACGYRINYGGGAGSGNWSYPDGSGQSKNEDSGQPLWPVAFTEVGNHTVRLRVRDPLNNEVTVQFNVNVTAAPTATNIPVSAGAWPTFTSGSRYTLDAGGDYRSFGNLDTGNLHNVIIEKTGEGADPRIAAWRVDPRSKFGETTLFPTRARHVRLVNIDMDSWQEGQRGFDYCGVIGGRVRQYSSGSQVFFFSEGTNEERSACRLARGCFFVGCELNNIGSANGFTLFGTWKHLHLIGVNTNAIDTGSTTWLVLRTYGTKHSYRHSKIRISHTETGSCGTPLSILGEAGPVETIWPDTDLVGALGSSTRYGLVNEHSAIFRSQMYDATSSRANGVFSTGGNPSGSNLVRPWLVGSEDCVWYPSGDIGLLINGYQLGGRGVFLRNARRNMGAGSYVGHTTENPNSVGNPGNTDTEWHGPYFVEEANTRPVPTPF
jgi:hypothetical protein